MKKIKTGTHLYLSPDAAHIGSLTHGARITDSDLILEARALMRLAGRNVEEINEALLQQLQKYELLDTEEGSIKLTKRSSETISAYDASYQQLRKRIAPELSQLTLKDASDGGVTGLSARQEFAIELSGNSRVTSILFALLIASGATNTRISPAHRSARSHIVDSDIGAPFVSANEVGKSHRAFNEELRTSLSLFPIDKSCNYAEPFLRADIKIHCGPIDPEILALWMNSNQPHLIIGNPHSGEVTIGPLVEPGIGPCNRCLSLLERDNYGFSQDQGIPISEISDFPLIVAYNIASLVADLALRYCADIHDVSASEVVKGIGNKKESGRARSELVGKVIHLSYQSAPGSTLIPRVFSITRHPLCGCAFGSLAHAAID